MSYDDILATRVDKHAGGNLSRERATVVKIQILGTQRHTALSRQLLRRGVKIGEWRTNNDTCVARNSRQAGHDLVDESSRKVPGTVHFPVSRNQRLPHKYSVKQFWIETW